MQYSYHTLWVRMRHGNLIHEFTALILNSITICLEPFNTWWKQKGHTYVNKPAPESCRFAQVCVTFLLPTGIKGKKLLQFESFQIMQIPSANHASKLASTAGKCRAFCHGISIFHYICFVKKIIGVNFLLKKIFLTRPK